MTRFTIVFTGTQQGMTPKQKRVIRNVFEHGVLLKHGCCIGSDDEAGQIWAEIHKSFLSITGYPSTIAAKRVNCQVGLMHPPAPALQRNGTMIDDAIKLGNPLCTATPKEMQEEIRSGTWSTVRYARRRNVPIIIAWPDGTWDWDVIEGILCDDVPAERV